MSNFLADYREFVKTNEANPVYHIFSALSALASLISRRVWIDQGFFQVFPDLYIVLVGPPGNKKTTAMKVAQVLTQEVGNVPITTDALSMEKLIEDIAAQERTIEGIKPEWKKNGTYCPMTIYASELSSFLGVSQANMISFLTSIYGDTSYSYRTRHKGEFIIPGPFINFLACTTPDWITTYMRSDVIGGGFSRRALFVYETEDGPPNPRPSLTPEERSAWGRCVAYGNRLKSVHGQFQWAPDAATFFDNWYCTRDIPLDDNIRFYYKTKPVLLLKVAMLLALSESPTLILQKHHLTDALELLKLPEANLPRVFEGLGRNELHSAATKVVEVLLRLPFREVNFKDCPGKVQIIELSELQSLMFKTVNTLEMDQVMHHLTSSNKVREVTMASGKKYIYLKP